MRFFLCIFEFLASDFPYFPYFCTANQALKKQPLAWYLEDKKDSSRAEFFVTAFVLGVVRWGE